MKSQTDVNYIQGTPYVGMNVKMYHGPGGYGGDFSAWDPVAGKEVWKITDRYPVWSGALVTAGDVVFFGTMDGWFKAVDARSGKELWKFKTGSGIIGQPVTLQGAGWQAVHRDRSRDWRMGRCGGLGRARRTRSNRGAGLRRAQRKSCRPR